MRQRKQQPEMKTRALTIVMEPSVFERLRARAFEERCTVGEIVRRAVGAYLKAKGEGPEKGRYRENLNDE